MSLGWEYWNSLKQRNLDVLSGQLKITNAPFSLNLSTIPAVGFARITDLGLTLNCGFLTGTVINFNKYS